jgi:hypothetical protein
MRSGSGDSHAMAQDKHCAWVCCGENFRRAEGDRLRAQHWRRVARVAQRARVRSGVPGAAGYSLVTGVRARHRARWDLLGDGGERAEIRDVN